MSDQPSMPRPEDGVGSPARDVAAFVSEPWPAAPVRRRWPLHVKILLGLLLGAGIGLAVNLVLSRTSAPGEVGPSPAAQERLTSFVQHVTDPVGKVFLRLVLMVVVPLVFSALSLGVLELGDIRRLGRIGVRTLLLTLVLSFTAVAIGLVLVNLIQPGKALPAEQRVTLLNQYGGGATETISKARRAKPLRDTLLDIIPENPLQEMVGALDGSSKGNGMLAVMFFALAFGTALTVVPESRRAVLVAFLEGLFDVSMVIIGFAMRLAPIAVACLMFSLTSRLGFDIIRTLGWFVATALLGMALHLLVVYPAAILAWGRRSPFAFFRASAEAMLTAFGTSSSNATLPTALRVAREKLKLPAEISQFVLTIGSTGNQNGTALYEGVVVLFLAQLFGVELSLAQQVSVVLMSVLAGVGTAGVPGGSLPLIVLVLESVQVPGEGIGIILGVDRLLDMCRTVLNVTGDLAIATCVAGQEGTVSPRDAAV